LFVSDTRTRLRRTRCERGIRAGEVPPETLLRVKADVEARLQIASPSFLEKYREQSRE